MNGFIVKKDAVRLLAMLPKRFSMIGHHGNNGVVVRPELAQRPGE